MKALTVLFGGLFQWVMAFAGFDDIRVRSPEYLPLLLLVPVIIILGAWVVISQRNAACMLDMRYPVVRRAAATALIAIALAAFVITRASPFSIVVLQKPVYKGEAVQFIIDLSNSQHAEDIHSTDASGKNSMTSRLAATVRATSAAVDSMSEKGVSFFCLSYFTFAYNPLLDCTDDMGNFKKTLERLDTALASGSGTNLLTAFDEDYTFVRSILPPDTRITAVVVTDGGREVCRKDDGTIEVIKPDWSEEALRQRVEALMSKEKVRLIPVGVGGRELVPVSSFDTSGRRFYITCQDGGVSMTRLDAEIIEQMAQFAGDKNRHFILEREEYGAQSFASWLSSYMTAELIVDHYISQESTSDLRRWTRGVAMLSGALALGAAGLISRVYGKIFRRK